jgi:uncharacterized membrane protein YraQ (UPF0718 family)
MSTALALIRSGAVRIDPAVAAIVAILIALALIAPHRLLPSVDFALGNLVAILPYLAVSIGLAAYASASGADNLIARVFAGRTMTMVVMAALIGAVSPFCSCGVIPLIAALLTMGVPLAPVMAFWLASPIMDPSMFALTAGTLGMQFAVAKTIAAFGIGLFGGFGMWALTRLPAFGTPLRAGIGDGGCAGSRIRSPKPVVWRFWHDPARREKFVRTALQTTLFLGKWLALAFLLEALMIAYIPAETVAHVLGSDGVLTVLMATLVGVPAYLNGYAALPLVSGLIGQGMAPGVGMAFLVAGGVTSIPAAIAVFALARLPVFLAYVGFALAGALITGLVYGMVA